MIAGSHGRVRVALAHDWLCGYRGGEAVLDALVRMVEPEFEIAGLFVMFDDGRRLTPAIDRTRKVVSFLGQLPGASRGLRRWLLPCYSGAVQDLSRRLAAEHSRKNIDLLISSSSAAIKGLQAPVDVPHLCYIHSPARYIWSQGDRYEQGSLLRRVGLRALRRRFQEWDRSTAANVNWFIANSHHTREEVRRCYQRAASVVHPPVRTDYFTPGDAADQRRRDGWLVVSALEPYKAVDVAIRAANARRQALTIIGDGSIRSSLEREAGPTVRFLGRVPDERVREAYRSARLLVFPQVEDFGIVAVEAQSCGCPVVAFGRGGALDSVVDGVTGRIIQDQTAEAIIRGAECCPSDCDVACRANAERFSQERFVRSMRLQIRAVLSGDPEIPTRDICVT